MSKYGQKLQNILPTLPQHIAVQYFFDVWVGQLTYLAQHCDRPKQTGPLARAGLAEPGHSLMLSLQFVISQLQSTFNINNRNHSSLICRSFL